MVFSVSLQCRVGNTWFRESTVIILFPISRQWRPVIKAASRDVNLASVGCLGCGQVGIIDVKVLSAPVGQASGQTYSAAALLRNSRPLLWFCALDNLSFFNPRIAIVIRLGQSDARQSAIRNSWRSAGINFFSLVQSQGDGNRLAGTAACRAMGGQMSRDRDIK